MILTIKECPNFHKRQNYPFAFVLLVGMTGFEPATTRPPAVFLLISSFIYAWQSSCYKSRFYIHNVILETMSIKLQLYKSKKNTDGTHPIVIRIHERGSRFLITLPFKAKPNQWNGQCYKGIKPNIKENNKRLAFHNCRAW